MRPVKNILILGYGRLGEVFARLYGARYTVRGVRRTPLAPAACELVLAPIQSERVASELAWADAVIFSPTSGSREAAAYRDTYLGNLSFALARLADRPRPATVVLIGSTGIYPSRTPGSWSEERPILVEDARQETLLLTEHTLRRSNQSWVILRCGGLYDTTPVGGALVRRGAVRTSELADQPVALVHREDVAGVIDRVLTTGIRGEIFNVVDDSELRRGDWYRWIARLRGLPVIEDGPPPPAVERRIPNSKLKLRLDYRFRHRRRLTDDPQDAAGDHA